MDKNHNIMETLDSLLSFARLTNELSDTERFIALPRSNRRETVSEHCTQLALISWFLIDKYKLPLDRQRVLEYSLVHDITEATTGDFPTHLKECDRSEKQRLEEESLKSLKCRYPDAFDMWRTYEKYKGHDDEESRFVYSLDKLLPTLNIYMNSCKEWRSRNPDDLEWYFRDLMKRMKPSPLILAFWIEIYERAIREHPELKRNLALDLN